MRGESNMMRRIAGLAAAALVASGMGLAALGPGVGIAQAEPNTGTWCPGDRVPGGFAHDEVDWDWTVCHRFYAMSRGYPPHIVGLKVEDGGSGGNWRLVAGENTNPCPWCL
jgi:hypothetical protein